MAAFKQQTGALRGFDLGVGTVLPDEQVRRRPDIEFGNHLASSSAKPRNGYITTMMLDLTDEESAALTRLLRRTIDGDRYPLSPRLAPLKAILAKVEPRVQQAEPPPALRPGDAPRPRQRRR
jgi:hypothetical protein